MFKLRFFHMQSHEEQGMKWAGWWLLFCLNPIAHGAPLSLAAPVEYIPLLRPFYEEWFAKARVEFTFIPCTLARCRKLVDADSTIDGDIARISGLEQTHTQMIPVGVAIGEVTIYAQSQQDARWPPASQELVGCLRGIQWCKRYLDSRRIVWFNDEKQGLALLKHGRTDWVIRLQPSNQSPLAAPWKRVSDMEVYLYLNKSRQPHIAALIQSQQQLIASGRWQQMQERYLSALLTPIR